MRITLTRRLLDWHAALDDGTWDCGSSRAEAIGNLLLTAPEKFTGEEIRIADLRRFEAPEIAQPVKCPNGNHLVFFYPSGQIVPHLQADGKECAASRSLLPP
jgi:hypothetical protein